MPASYVSPGLYVREIDESLFVPALADTPFGVVGFSTWGPIAGDPDDNVTTPTLVTSGSQLSKLFGPVTGVPVDSYSEGVDEYPTQPMLYAASRYLRSGRRCYIVRIADLDTTNNASTAAAKSSTMIKGAPTDVAPPVTNSTNPLVIPNPSTSLITAAQEANGLLANDDYFFAVTFTNSFGGETTVGDSETSVTVSSGNNTASVDVTYGGSWPTNATYANLYMGTVSGSLKIVKEKISESSFRGGVNVRTLPFDSSSYVYKVSARYKGTLGNRIKLGVAPGGDTSVSKPTKKYTISLISPVNPSIVSQVEVFDGVASNPNQKNSDGTSDDALSRITNSTSEFISFDLISKLSSVTAKKSDNTSVSDPAYPGSFTAAASIGEGLFTGIGPTDGITTSKDGYVRVGVSFTGANGGETSIVADSTPITLSSVWNTNGSWVSGNGVVDVTVGSTVPQSTDVSSVNIYLSKSVAADSPSATAADLRLVKTIPIANWVDSEVFSLDILPGKQLPANTSTETGSTLSGGLDGLPKPSATTSEKDSFYIGKTKDAVQEATGLQIFRDTESTDVNLLAVPAISTAAVVNALIDVAEKRGDCIALVDPPSKGGTDGQGTNGIKSADDVIKWHNGVSGLVDAPTAALNSSYAALFWPWVQIQDGLNSQKLFIPPSAIAAEIIAQSDYASEQWFAPAGLNRGNVRNVLKAQFLPTLGERDAMYSQGNAINPIATFRGSGIVVWGQRTLQRLPTALDRINVRRLLIFLRKVIDRAAVGLVFEQNDSAMWRKFSNIVSPVLDGVKARRGIVDYRIVMDETTNTPDVIEQNQAVGDIYIKPTKTAEIIVLNFIVTSQTSEFTENSTAGNL